MPLSLTKGFFFVKIFSKKYPRRAGCANGDIG